MSWRAPADDDAALAERAYTAAATAYRGAGPGWERGVRAALGELLDLLATESERTARCTVLTAESSDALDRRSALVARFVDLLGPSTGSSDIERADVVAEAVGQSVVELIGRYVEERRVDELPDALPTATLLVLTPFVGPDTAEKLATASFDGRR